MTSFLPAFLTRVVRAPAARSERMPDRIELDGRSVPLAFREHPTAKRLIMRLTPDGGVLVTMPRRTRRGVVLEFVERHRAWASARLAERDVVPAIGDGATLMLRGKPLALRHRAELRASRLVHQDGGDELHIGGQAQFMGRRVKDFLVREARRDLAVAVERHAERVGLRPRAMAIKDTSSRWGSCTADRRLSFSFRIVMAPPEVLDYLAAHEVAHFVHMNHGDGFWALCRELCPGTERGRRWLKREGTGLQAIRF